MPEPSFLEINEIFWSFQGEGARTGVPSIFLRLSGCSLRCVYCDTQYAWEEGRFMEMQDIIAQIDGHKKRYPRSQVVITGGEPLEQDLSLLVERLHDKDFFTAIETNGSLFQDLAVDWWTVSPKDGNDYHIDERLFQKINEVKLIVNKSLTLQVIESIRRIRQDFPIFLQPDWTDNDRFGSTFRLFQQCQERGIKDIHPGLQLHKIYNVK